MALRDVGAIGIDTAASVVVVAMDHGCKRKASMLAWGSFDDACWCCRPADPQKAPGSSSIMATVGGLSRHAADTLSPAHVLPLPVKPVLQVHVLLPAMKVQSASALQPPLLVMHGSTPESADHQTDSIAAQNAALFWQCQCLCYVHKCITPLAPPPCPLAKR